MRITTRVIIVCPKTRRIPLWIKLKSFTIATAGGTAESFDRTIQHTGAREVEEETTIKRDPKEFVQRGWLRIYKHDQYRDYLLTKIIYLFVLCVDSRKVKTPNTGDMKDGQWYSINDLPFPQMADYYRVWVHDILHIPICRDIWLDKDSRVVRFEDVDPDQEASAPPSPTKRKPNVLSKKK